MVVQEAKAKALSSLEVGIVAVVAEVALLLAAEVVLLLAVVVAAVVLLLLRLGRANMGRVKHNNMLATT